MRAVFCEPLRYRLVSKALQLVRLRPGQHVGSQLIFRVTADAILIKGAPTQAADVLNSAPHLINLTHRVFSFTHDPLP